MTISVLSAGTVALGFLEDALDYWNKSFSNIKNVLTKLPSEWSPQMWTYAQNIISVLQATGVSLLIIFFFYGLFKAGIDYHDIFRSPKAVIMAFVRIGVAQFFVIHAMDFLLAILELTRELIQKVGSSFMISNFSVPPDLESALNGADWWAGIGSLLMSFFGAIIIAVLSLIVLVIVYGRFFKIFILTAIAPIPLAGLASEPTSYIGQNFIKSYISECLRGLLIIIACFLFSIFAQTFDLSQIGGNAAEPGGMTLRYVGMVSLQLLMLVVMTKGSDRMVKEIFGI